MTLNRVRVAWTGFDGGPGVSTFFCQTPDTFVAALHTFLTNLSSYIPNTVSLTIEPGGDVFDPLNGVLSGSWTAAATPAPVNCTGASTAARGAGLMLRWNTGSVINGHRLRGRTFIVPASKNAFDDNGNPGGGVRTDIAVACGLLIAAEANNMVVWNRPRLVTPSWTDVHGKVHPSRPAVTGGFSAVRDGGLSPVSAVLRSRRD